MRLYVIVEQRNGGEPLCHLRSQAGSVADWRPELAKWGRQPRSRRQPWWGSRRVLTDKPEPVGRQVRQKLVGGNAPPPGPGKGAGTVFLLHRKVQAEHSSEPSP